MDSSEAKKKAAAEAAKNKAAEEAARAAEEAAEQAADRAGAPDDELRANFKLRSSEAMADGL
eukprot:CAMPEP_0172728514 /NCGR_PEP_ID=MMETSP1074-20121228/92287_1 /TAXON_ID=2916 /ORGANISM="Ceratium fusus, Strain PA161109" /LENGTH=61 /DNA_ID=CAMNT_0013555771 /DNA_START=93 /DNA_END=279 /DNA_ORIENTATION=-